MKLLSFDAADTLVRVNWSPGGSAIECAREVGLEVGTRHRESFDRLLRTRWAEYCEINLRKNDDECDLFWTRLTDDWLQTNALSRSHTQPIINLARERLYGEGISYFALFEDVPAALDWARSEGYSLAVLSNWDYSLKRILKRLGVFERFDLVVASLEVGPEKPDPALFAHVLDNFGFDPSECLHIGDHPIDDVQGARGAGWRALLIDRNRDEPGPGVIRSLSELPEAIRSIT